MKNDNFHEKKKSLLLIIQRTYDIIVPQKLQFVIRVRKKFSPYLSGYYNVNEYLTYSVGKKRLFRRKNYNHSYEPL